MLVERVRIITSADRMGRMVSDVMDLARGRLGGTFPIVRRRVNLHEIAGRVIDELHVAHPDRQIHLDLRGDGRLELDPDRTAQAISNLVGNALQHGAVESPVEVRICDGEGGVVVEVKNRGEPISEELLPRLFEPFKGSREGGRGLGLGLWIVSEIVRAHGGAIAVRSTAADGTTFTVRLPRG